MRRQCLILHCLPTTMLSWSVLKFDNYLYLTKNMCTYRHIVYKLYVYYNKAWQDCHFWFRHKKAGCQWCQRRKCSASRKMNLKLLLIFEFLLILVFVAKDQLKQRKSMFSAQTLPGPLTNFGIRNTAESFAFIIDQSAWCTTVTLIWSLTN